MIRRGWPALGSVVLTTGVLTGCEGADTPPVEVSATSAAPPAADAGRSGTGGSVDLADPAERAGAFVVLRTVDGSAAVLRDPSQVFRGGPQAIVAGELAAVTGGCLGFRYDDGTETVVVWPSTTTALDDAVGVDVPGTGAYRLGDDVEGTGGYGDAVLEGPLGGCPSGETGYLDEDQP